MTRPDRPATLPRILAVLAAAWFVYQVIHWAGPAGGEDLAKHWLAPQIARSGADPYAPGALRTYAESTGLVAPGEGGFHFLERYHYPPLNILLWAPLSLLSLRAAVVAWIVAGAALWIAARVLLQRVVGLGGVGGLGGPGGRGGIVGPRTGSETVWLFWAAMLAFDPALSTLALGQFEILVFALLVSALVLDRAGRTALAGAPLALAILIKLLPLAWLAGLFLLGRRRTALWTVVWAVAITAASVPAIGLAPYAAFLRAEGYFAALAPGWEHYLPINLSVPSFLLKAAALLSDGHALENAAAWAGRLAIVLLAVGGLLVACRARGRGPRAELAALGCLSAAASLASPMTFQHHLVWLALPLAVALVRFGPGSSAEVAEALRTDEPGTRAPASQPGSPVPVWRSGPFLDGFLLPWILVGLLDAWGQPVRDLTHAWPEPQRGIAWSILPALVALGTAWTGYVACAIALGRDGAIGGRSRAARTDRVTP